MAGAIIITRAEPGNDETAARLAEREVAYIKAPMLTLQATGHELPDMSDFAGLLFTSANGVRAFCEASGERGLTAWCVGPATLAEAERSGFSDVMHGDGNAQDLAALVIETSTPNAGKLLHMANAAAAGNLAKTLQSAGFKVEFSPLYAAIPAEAVPAEAAAALAGSAACIVLVHSAKGAEAFANLTERLDLSIHHLVAVSKAAAAPLLSRNFKRVHVAARPNEAALLATLFLSLIHI